MSKKKHKPCSYMTPSVDGRRKNTIKKQKEKERIEYENRQFEKFSKMFDSIYERGVQ